MKIDMCAFYDWLGRPVCAKEHIASIKCHSYRRNCPDYQESESRFNETESIQQNNKERLGTNNDNTQ